MRRALSPVGSWSSLSEVKRSQREDDSSSSPIPRRRGTGL